MPKDNQKDSKQKQGKVVIVNDGPYVVTGSLPLSKEIIVTDEEGFPIRWKKGKVFPSRENYSLCRCGLSKNKPYCDGTHVQSNFDGTETANRGEYLERADRISGPNLVLTDAEDLCAVARFCDREGGVWELTEDSDDPEARKAAIQEACDCPAGRLVAWDKKKEKPIEPQFKPSISLVEDPEENVSGPIWVKGGVPVVSSDGKTYEIRNRVTLCRCGESSNKPFCDGTHISVGFSDGDAFIEE